MRSVCFAICYFGPWPRWFELYLSSCRNNPTVDFLIFTDGDSPDGAPPNVRLIPMTLQEFSELATRKLGFPVRISDPYKLCDFKLTYGVVLEEYLESYDFWGCADIDVIYGDIRKFLTNERLDSHDVLTSREEFLVGHMTLFRNSQRVNRLYEQSADHVRVLQATKHFSFGECNFRWTHLGNGDSIFDEPVKLDSYAVFKKRLRLESMTHIVRRMEREGRLRVFFRTMIKDRPELQSPDWQLCWDRGSLNDVNTGEEPLYLHMMDLKRTKGFL
jgi:hypothetical protein